MSQCTDRVLVSSQTSVGSFGNGRPKAEFTHYGFLVVDAWCAYGVQLAILPTVRADLVNDSGPVLESFKELEQEGKPHITFADTRKAGEKGFPKAGQRVLNTWPLNPLWSEFLVALDISDADCTSAAGQVDVFVQKQKWGNVECPLPAFICCVQLWYYGLPVDEVCNRFVLQQMCLLCLNTCERPIHVSLRAVEVNHQISVCSIVWSRTHD
jgi:hypothetical protein